MPELESIASPLGAECDPEDTLADVLEVHDGPLEFTYSGVCGFAAAFDYAG